ncbi:MAG: amino acid ABC transporter permease [Rhodospirillales bacterium]|nr:amino acid ABC transporter permease [Rhodospirillales bacterium]
MAEQRQYEVGMHPDLPPPASLVGVVGWMRANLVSSPANTFFTLLAIYLIYLLIPPMLDWLIFSAAWVGDDNTVCKNETGGPIAAACWPFIKAWMTPFMFGRYPESELWRIKITYVMFGVALLALVIPQVPFKKWFALFLLIPFPVICFYLYVGGSFGLMYVETNLWGGLFLTLVIAITGIVASLPIGILLALGRRSNMPVVKAVCVAFIELWRGVPLISVLFMSSVMFPLFMPEGVNFDKLLRALVGVTLFSSAYMAEVVRGGLQAIPKGQYEGAQALGLNFVKMMYFIVMPQALKMVIPGIVNTFIGLFKDTTLVGVIGLLDFLAMIQAGSSNPDWLGYLTTGFAFAALVYWCFCFGMSQYSQHLERKLHTGH